ncbi:MAG TPA: alpha/beta hydrolase [Acidimicrobiia bacterium]|nr:alpha/beta hydrolase [Acidimicrobiia bacterium]
MADRIGGFRSAEDAARYFELYDDLVDRFWPVEHEELDVPTRFGSTHVRRSGTHGGAPLVLIHPTSGSSVGWHRLAAPLCERHTVYTPDTIGTVGRSIQTAPIRSPRDLVIWLDDVLDALDLDAIHLLGYSEGGWIAGLHAATTERHARLATVTLIEPGGAIERIPRRLIASMVLRGSRTLIARDKHRAIRNFNHWMNGDVEISDDEIDMLLLAFKTFRQRLPTPDRLSDEQLASITAPSLLLLGADTRLYDPDRVADRARRLLNDVRVDIVPGAGHGLPFQYPERTTTRVLEFIESDHDSAAQR